MPTIVAFFGSQCPPPVRRERSRLSVLVPIRWSGQYDECPRSALPSDIQAIDALLDQLLADASYTARVAEDGDPVVGFLDVLVDLGRLLELEL